MTKIQYLPNNKKEVFKFVMPDLSESALDGLMLNPYMPLFVETKQGSQKVEFGDYLSLDGEFVVIHKA